MKKIILFKKIFIIGIIMSIFGVLQQYNVTFAAGTPTLTSVHISSDNTYSGSLLKYGDNVTLNIVGSESLTGVTASFNGVPASSIVGSGDTWTITSQNIVSGVGLVNFVVNFSNLTGDVGTVSGTTDGSSVLIDAVLPSASVTYSTTSPTSGSVLATLTGASEHIVVTNNSGLTTHNFTSNGSFTFEYRDDAGNTGSTIATVSNINTSLPTITLNGSSVVNLVLGTSYVENGATWSDQTDGTGVVSTISGSVNTNVLGTYVLDYIKVNSLGLTGSTTRTINVVQAVPTGLSFTNLTGVELSTLYTSNTATITGISDGTQISVVGGDYAIGTGAFTNTTGTINNGNTVRVRVMSSNTYNTTTTATLMIGGASANFSVTTKSGSGTEKYVSSNPTINMIAGKLDKLIASYNKSDDPTVIQLRNSFLIELENYVNVFNSGDKSSLPSIKNNILNIFKNLITELKKHNNSNNFVNELSNKIDAQNNNGRVNREQEQEQEHEGEDDNSNSNVNINRNGHTNNGNHYGELKSKNKGNNKQNGRDD
nr:DUF5011 domain-containing protein [Candidatus Gracilibacteria bacterium]